MRAKACSGKISRVDKAASSSSGVPYRRPSPRRQGAPEASGSLGGGLGESPLICARATQAGTADRVSNRKGPTPLDTDRKSLARRRIRARKSAYSMARLSRCALASAGRVLDFASVRFETATLGEQGSRLGFNWHVSRNLDVLRQAAQHVVTVLDVQAGNAFVVMADDNAIGGFELGVLIGGKFPQVGVGGRRLASARWG